jgi:small subunit ribosomal protein S7
MGRSKKREIRELLPDPKYNNSLVSRLINCVMMQGKKSIAEKIVYNSFDIIEKQGKDPLQVYKSALENIKPMLELKSRRIGGANYLIPVEVDPERRLSLAIRWLVNAARERKEKLMFEKLANEILAAASGEGGAVKKKEETHKMAEANKAFAHFRW